MEAPSSVLIITANMITSNSKFHRAFSMTFLARCNVKLKCAVKISIFGAKLLSGTSICFVEHTVKLTALCFQIFKFNHYFLKETIEKQKALSKRALVNTLTLSTICKTYPVGKC